MSDDSFLNSIQSKLKEGLKPTTTKTTFPDGSVQLSINSGVFSERTLEKSYGFVVDDKPDLSVGVVRPWLLVSSQDVANDELLLAEHKITHILSLLPGFNLTPKIKEMIEKHLIIDVYDEDCFQIESKIFSNAFEFIDDAKSSGGVALVHCNAGISRAPTVSIAYLMSREKFTFDSAWESVKAARPSMKPNPGFVSQLKKL